MLLVLTSSLLGSGCAKADNGALPPKAQAVPGVVVKHLPQQTDMYIGSPSICILPNGTYIATHDIFGPKANTGVSGSTFVYSSSDKGATWRQIALLTGQYWSNIFYHRNALYILGTDKGHGNIVIRRSTDNGLTWTTPSDETNGLLFKGHYHTAPTPIAIHNGRLWRAFEYADAIDSKLPDRYGPLMINADEKGDLLKASSWSKTNYLVSDPTYMNGKFRGWLEGNALVTKDDQLVNMLRVHIHPGTMERAAIVKVSGDGQSIYFQSNAGFVTFPGGSKKFTIRYDQTSDRYWTLINNIPAKYSADYPANVRNYLSLASSPDLLTWTMHKVILRHDDQKYHGFQYVDWLFEGDAMVFLSRTGYDDDGKGANSAHNANFLTFHRIDNFRQLVSNVVTD